MDNPPIIRFIAFLLLAIVSSPTLTCGEEPWHFILPEQRCTQVRSPEQLCSVSIPHSPPPPTIKDPQFDAPPREWSLSDAINVGLNNLDVVRVLGGVTAASSGRTVYDVAIVNTRIDQARANFDPSLRVNNSWALNDNPVAVTLPGNPGQAVITGTSSDGHNLDVGLGKRTVTGGVIDFGILSNQLNRNLSPLNPQLASSVNMQYTQPLLRGAGARVNQVSIVLARIETEQSYFQYKSAVQNHVQSVIEGYWLLVQARTDLWARQQQVEQLEFANRRAQDRLEVGDANAGDAAQTRVAYENFRASLIAAEANVLQREAALRNVLGLPPYEPERIVPTSALIEEKVQIDWDALIDLAGTQRPDIIELKLILEADQQRLLLQNNQALPSLDGFALYRWNGLEGTMPNGNYTASQPGQFNDWNMGINFSVPLGMRRDRALLRQQELIVQRDRANLQQGLHQATHLLALNYRNLEQFFEQYRRYQVVREAASLNLDVQLKQYNEGLIQFIVVLQAIVDWGNSVSNEAQSLVSYNTELAKLERETGTILESHGIAFYEERFGSIGPLGRLAELQAYPRATRPTESNLRYPGGDRPSEEGFDLTDPLEGNSKKSNEDTGSDDSLDSVQIPGQSAGQRLLTAPIRMAEKFKGLF